MIPTQLVERIIHLRRRTPNTLWAIICRTLSSASDGQTVDELLGQLHTTINPHIYDEFRTLLLTCNRDQNWRSLGFAFDLAGKVVEQQDAEHQVELVWTGPPASIHLRRLEQVLYDLINEGKNRILLVTFVASHINHLNSALHEAVKRNVQLRLILEFSQTSEGQLSFDALNAFSPNVREHADIYFWPAEYRERNTAGRLGKLHAKCAVVDRSAIISTANLTDDAFNRNMEMGVLFTNHAVAEQTWQHFDTLITQRVLRLVSELAG